MQIYKFGNPSSKIVFIQPVDDHDLGGIEKECAEIKESTGKEFLLIAVKVEKWNEDLSPWNAPAVFGKDDFGSGASKTLGRVLALCGDKSKVYYVGGYSLAGLFALWAAYQTDAFAGVAAASPSVWFPRFTEYMKESRIGTSAVYLSLGDKEEKTRNPIMATVGNKIRETYDALKTSGVRCILEWNRGNHFKDAELRTAKAFSWLIKERSRDK